jgi:membrane-bound lytic murein transglycosylase
MIIAGLPYASVSDGACAVAYTTSTVDNIAILVQGSGVYVYKDTPSVNVTLAEFSGKYLLFAGHYTAA